MNHRADIDEATRRSAAGSPAGCRRNGSPVRWRSPSTARRSPSSGRSRRPRPTKDASDAERSAAVDGRIKAFREDTRDQRIAIAREAEHRFGRKVAWGVDCDGRRALFTHLSVPVMTRLRQPERQVLDTLVDAGVARSRSEALAWAVRLVGAAQRGLAARAARGDGAGAPGARAGSGVHGRPGLIALRLQVDAPQVPDGDPKPVRWQVERCYVAE